MESQYKEKTSKIYGTLFTNYSDEQFEESVALFPMRQKMWGIDLNWFKNRVCLDAGCGGGRFVVALARLGAKKVHGIDLSQDAVSAANQRIQERNLNERASVQQGSVLELPFPDSHFDYVVCSGVIHHTPDPYRAFTELVRVLKPGGKLFFSVYGKGGLKWLANDVFRYSLCKIVPFRVLERFFALIGIPANKCYNTLDNLYVPYCFRYKEVQIRDWLTSAGFENIHRLKFERYDYETLKSRIIHGEGWLQFYADKK